MLSENEATFISGAKTANQIAGLSGVNVPGVTPVLSGYQAARNWQGMGTEQKAATSVAVAGGAAAAAGYAIPGLNIALAAYQGLKAGQQGYNQYYVQGTQNQKRGYEGALALGGVGAFTGLGVISMANSFRKKSGKDVDQRARDYFRKDWQTKGLADDEYKISLADGSFGDIGNAGPHKIKDMTKLVGGDTRSEMSDYDIDYTNDMDYASGMAGTTLNRLLYGGRNKNVDDMGALTGNALLGSVGHGADMSAQNFSTVMANARGLYSKAGIKSKEDALRLVGLAAKQGRLTAADQAQAMQTLDMMYDPDGFKKGSILMSGRWAGINNMKDAPERAPTVSVGEHENLFAKPLSEVLDIQVQPATQGIATRSMDELRAQNIARFGQV